MGLVPDGIEAALVPFKTECQAIPMYAGLIKRARNSGEVSSIWADVVYEGETVDVWVEDGERKWDHVKEGGGRINAMSRGGEIIGAYGVAKLKDGSPIFEPLTKGEIEKIRAVSRAKDGPAWKNWYTEMAKKSAIRRLAKVLPISAEDRRAIIESDEDTIGIKDVTPARPSLEERIAAETAPEAPAEPDDADVVQVDAPDPSQGFPGAAEWVEGQEAREAGAAYEDNPYAGNPDTVEQAHSWAGGWKAGEAS